MSNDIQVGDVCEIVIRNPLLPVTIRYAGTTCTVQALCQKSGSFGVMHRCELFDGEVADIASMFLRKRPPKADDRGRDDFVPADPEAWDLAHWHPTKTKELA